MDVNNSNKKDYCSYCQAVVIFDEIHTHHKLAIGQPKAKVAVFRCPKCKKLVGPIIPITNKVSEI
jgi:hypothetical protein